MLKTFLNQRGLAGMAIGISLLSAAVLTTLPGSEATESYIIQGVSLAHVKTAVEAAGGEITHELGVIRAVGALLTERQRATLTDAGGVHRLYPNRSVIVSAAGGTESIADRFSDVSYANNDGTQRWSSDWVEFNDDGNVDSGRVRIAKGRLRLKKSARGVYRTVDLSGSTSATLSLSYRRKGWDSEAEYVTVALSGDGGATWTEVARLAGPANDSGYQERRIDISDLATAVTQLRFQTSRDLGKHPVYVDNVEIVYQTS